MGNITQGHEPQEAGVTGGRLRGCLPQSTLWPPVIHSLPDVKDTSVLPLSQPPAMTASFQSPGPLHPNQAQVWFKLLRDSCSVPPHPWTHGTKETSCHPHGGGMGIDELL